MICHSAAMWYWICFGLAYPESWNSEMSQLTVTSAELSQRTDKRNQKKWSWLYVRFVKIGVKSMHMHDLLTTTSTPTTKPPHTPFMSLTYSTDNYWIEEEPLYLHTRKPSQRGSMFGSIFGIKKHAGSNVIHVSRADKIKLSSQYKKSQFRGRKTWEFSLMNSVIIDIWSSIGEADTSSWRNLRR